LVAVTATNVHAAIDAVWRIESAKLIAGLTRIVGDVGIAEDLAQDALVASSSCGRSRVSRGTGAEVEGEPVRPTAAPPASPTALSAVIRQLRARSQRRPMA
jgi:hypothetical protein